MEESVGARYRSVRLRLTDLLGSIDRSSWDQPVAACPGWRVHDVLGHLVGIIEDAFAGRLSGPPAPELTLEQVERHRDDDPALLLDQWSEMGPAFEDALSTLERWPAFIDVLSHEHDIRGALGDRSFRDHDDVVWAATLLSQSVPAGIELTVGGQPFGPSATTTVARLEITPFELVRLRMGRRSLVQVLAMAWDGDPGRVLEGMFVFGPAADDVVE